MASSGLLIVDKPGGMTSHDVVSRVRRAMGTRKVGHAGTLDPMATGVLVMGVERATRLLGHLALRDKAYQASIRLGASTVTDDAEGEVLAVAADEALAGIEDESIRAHVAGLTGEIDQRPSSVSAVKVAGRRSYDRVRGGEAVELPTRRVTVSSFDILRIARSDDAIDVDVLVECSTGTYVRALARDLGDRLGVGGHLTRLRRTRVGPFTADEAVSLDELDAVGATSLLAMSTVAARCFPTWTLDEAQSRAVSLGQRIAWHGPACGLDPVALVDGAGEFLALAHDDDDMARYLAVFA